MKFEVSERIQTSASKEEILAGLEEQFKKVSQSVQRSGESLMAKSIEASFGSVNRSDTTTVELRDTDDGYLLLANVHYPAFGRFLDHPDHHALHLRLLVDSYHFLLGPEEDCSDGDTGGLHSSQE